MALITGSIFLTNCYCVKSEIRDSDINLMGITLQKMIPGEINHEPYWRIYWNSHDSIFHAIYYNNYSGIVKKSINHAYGSDLILNQLNTTPKLKKLLNKHQLIFEVNTKKEKKYIIAKHFKILDPVHLPTEVLKNEN